MLSSFDKFKSGTMFLRELESFDGVSLGCPVATGEAVLDSSSIIDT